MRRLILRHTVDNAPHSGPSWIGGTSGSVLSQQQISMEILLLEGRSYGSLLNWRMILLEAKCKELEPFIGD